MPKVLFYSVRVTAENELGDRRTYDALEWEQLDSTDRSGAEHAAGVLATQLHADGYTSMRRTEIKAVTSTEA